jgi:outer membrane murein-binding lipoprotein Lpp
MSNLQISQYKIKPFGSEFHTRVETSYFCATPSVVQAGRRRHALTGSFLNLQGTRKQTLLGVFYTSLVALAGCATSAELESLRAEVAKANAVAARAEAGVSTTQRQLAALKKTSEPPQPILAPRATPATNPPDTSGYKWGRLGKD